MTPAPRIGIALAFACLLLLGAMPILADARPVGFDGLTFAVWLTVWQLLCALPLFFLESRTSATSALMPGRYPPRAVGIALLTGAMFGLSTFMYVVAAEKAGPVSMVIALQAYPLFAALLEAVFLGKRKTPAELFFTLLMLGALVYLTTEGTFRIAEVSWWSVFALGIPALWSVAHVLLRQLLVSTPITPNQVTVSRLVISGLFLALVAVAFGDAGLLLRGATDAAFQRAAFIMGLAYYLELILWFYAMRHIDVSVASSVTVPSPAVTMLIAIVLLGEMVERYQVLAMIVIAASMYGMLLAGRRKRNRQAA